MWLRSLRAVPPRSRSLFRKGFPNIRFNAKASNRFHNTASLARIDVRGALARPWHSYLRRCAVRLMKRGFELWPGEVRVRIEATSPNYRALIVLDGVEHSGCGNRR
jgi:hypothetical protein